MKTTQEAPAVLQKPRSRKDLYLEQYRASKEGGEPFFPDSLYRDTTVALIVVGLVFILSVVMPATSEAPADPTGRVYNPRPEWYFLFIFQFLKLFPGYLEPLAAVVLPGAAILALFLVPFVDVGLDRAWSRRKHMIGIGVAAVAGLVALTVAGALSPPVQPAAQEDPLVIEGARLYRDRNCSYCHSISGIGGAVGPDLGAIGARTDRETLATYLRNPAAMIPGTLHPKLQFTGEEMDALVAYLLTLGATVPFTDEAPRLVEQHCLACHVINGAGTALGPDLSNVGSQRTLAYLESFVAEPRSVAPSAAMPAFGRVLTQAQTRDIAAYLYSLRRAPAIPSAAPSR